MTKKQNNGRVILTYGRSLMSLSAAHSLGERGVDVIACDSVDMTVTQFSKHVSDTFVTADYEDDAQKYVQDLLEHVKKFKPNNDLPYVLMPMFRDARIIAKHRETFEPYITVAVPDETTINAVHPKDCFFRTCESLNINIPQTWQFTDKDALKQSEHDLPFPCLIKPTDAIGGRGISINDTYEDLEREYTLLKDEHKTAPLIQSLAKGEDYCLSIICDKGQIVKSMAYKNVHKFPRGSGAGVMRETVDDTIFLDDARILLEHLKWHGVAQIDYMWTGDQSDFPVMIELNPRFWAGLFHSIQSGADFPWLLYQLYAHGKITDTEDTIIGQKTKVPGLWALSAIQEIADNDLHFDQLKDAWGDLWQQQKHTPFLERLATFKDTMSDNFKQHNISNAFSAFRHDNKDAISELDFDDDPFIGLGILFVISSLLRHGELPPELKS